MSNGAAQIPLFKVFMAPEAALLPRLREVLYSGQISEGPPVVEFEQRFGAFVGQPNMLSFYSGTAALHVALLLAGAGPGDEVISSAMTAEPTNLAILHAGARVVWGDVDPRNGNLAAAAIEAKITPRTRAILVVHYGGIPASLAAIRAIAERHGIAVIEDAAHALGARYAGLPIGSHSEYAVYSLQAIKHLTTVDGGMLACRNPADLPRGRRLRWFGIDRAAPRTEVDVAEAGYKYHMNNVNATIGLVQLEYIRPVIARHIANGQYFDAALRGIPGIELCARDAAAEPSYWFYTVLAERRDELARRLTELGIGNSLVHQRNDRHSVFAASRCELPGLDRFYDAMLHIPCGWWVGDAERER
ncbi:MAG: aminotransferase class I/II-fold pyridoxal phosphate-dependent enzyme, partial [Pseudomonadota bacterium]